MTHNHDVMVGIEFLVRAAGDIPHRNVFGSIDVRGFKLPRLADIEDCECFTLLLQGFDLAGRDFEVHKICSQHLALGS